MPIPAIDRPRGLAEMVRPPDPNNFTRNNQPPGVRQYDNAGRLKQVVQKRFTEYGLSFTEFTNVIPPDDDQSTLFLCSGMQPWKSKFTGQTKERFGTLQSCIRTDDIQEVGDGSHLTSFQMLGNFSFGNRDYESSVEMWDSILTDLDLKIGSLIHVHPSQHWHKSLWLKRGYHLRYDPECEWSDGTIGGFCCEVYHDGLEIGNLVDTMGHSTDVGFGWERLLQVVSRKGRVDETEIFDTRLKPVLRDHYRTIEVLRLHGVQPGNKGRDYVCRRLIRRCLILGDDRVPENLVPWFDLEREKRIRCLSHGRKHWRKNSHQSPQWWWDTFGLTPDDLLEFQ